MKTNQNLTDTYMPISRSDAKEMGFKSSDIVIRRIGIKNVTCIKTQGTSEFAKRYATMLDSEARAELREKRCLLPNGKGGSIRCPECNSCEKCKKRLEFEFNTGKPLSLEQLMQADSEDDKTLDIAGQSESEGDILARIILEDLLSYLGTFKDKRYDLIFQMLYDNWGTKEIADELSMPWSTAKDAINKVRQLAQEHTKLTRD